MKILFTFALLSGLMAMTSGAKAAALQASPWLGHNLSHTSILPKSGQALLGTQAAGYAFSDYLFIGSSPWLLSSYNMYNLALKFSTPGLKEQNISLLLAYFKTGNYYPDFYVMEALSFWAIKTFELSEIVDLHLNLSSMYYFDETNPFSLRLEPYNNQPYQFNVSVLSDFKATKTLGFGLEFGAVGLNYHYPYLHIGTSARITRNSWLFQLGVSCSATMDRLGKPYTQKQSQSLREGGSVEQYQGVTVHPEAQVQYTF